MSEIIEMNLPKQFNSNKSEILFNISYPLLMSFETNGKVYVAYVLRMKLISQKVKLVISESTYDKILKVITSEKPFNCLFEESMTYVDTVSDKNIFKEVKTSKVSKYLPSNGFKLDKSVPNTINIDNIVSNLEIRRSAYLEKVENYPNFENNFKENSFSYYVDDNVEDKIYLNEESSYEANNLKIIKKNLFDDNYFFINNI